MSVKVEALTKIYGQQKAVNKLSFEAKKGEVLGFLGPNGAGKSTTMKMLTCFIPQTSGKASICGYDTQKQSMEVRSRVGYLPQNNPLYKDMYVEEYLLFIARLHQLKNRKAVVHEMIDRTGLEQEAHKLIGTLSGGYQQRVGLAQAMLHDPEVLILDEPTSGLDPNQLVDIRQLIKSLGQEKTVIFSSHIMQEIEALCDRVLIINKGELVANDRIENLRHKVAKDKMLTIEVMGSIMAADLEKISGIRSVKSLGNGRFQLLSTSEDDIRPAVFQFVVQKKLVLLEMQQENFTIEDIFQQLTKSPT